MVRLLVQTGSLVALLGLAAACGDSEGSGSGDPGSGGSGNGANGGSGNATTGGTGGAGAGGAGGEGGGECPDGPGFETPADVKTLNGLVANLVDDAGDPIGNVPVQLCGFDVCLFSDANGSGDVNVGAPPMNMMNNPAFKVGDGLVTGRIAYALPDGEDPVIIDAVVPIMTDGGQPLTAGGSASAGGVTVDVPAGATVEIDPFTYVEDADRTFRAVILSGAVVDEIAPGQNMDLIVAAAPIESHICPAAKVTVANDAGLAPGTAVEFLIHGTTIDEQYAGYREWQVISSGTVSADGSVIETAEGEGLPYLDTFAIRAN